MSVPLVSRAQTSNSVVTEALVCFVCNRSEKLLRCSRCKSAFYCTKDHQRLDWKRHKEFCVRESALPEPVNPRKHVGVVPERLTSEVARHNLTSEGEDLTGVLTPNSRSLVSELLHRQDSQENAYGGQVPLTSWYVEDPVQDALGQSSTTRADGWISPITHEGSSEDTILGARAESLNPALKSSRQLGATQGSAQEMPTQNHNGVKNFPEIQLGRENDLPPFLRRNHLDECYIDYICQVVIADMDQYGVCVMTDFLGNEKADAVLDEVMNMYSAGLFRDGQLVSNKGGASDLKTIRGDQITWLDGKEKHCQNIGMLISQVDAIIMRANKMVNNGKMGNYTINGRTKAMVACYPGHGSRYVKHVDNPNRDGRCITAIYYLNKDWDIQENGGLLRIFPEGCRDKVVDIEPLFDRILFFWSDRRNPHEVQPAHKTRYAITLWYFDAEERNQACRRYKREREVHMEPRKRELNSL